MLQQTHTHITRWLLLAAATIFAAGCEPTSPTSEYPLYTQDVEDDGQRLIGAWYGEINGAEAYVHVVEAEDGPAPLETLLISHSSRGGLGPWGKGFAQPALIGNGYFISVELDQNQNGEISDPLERGYHLLRYSVGRGYVTLFGPDQRLLAEAVARGQLSGDVIAPNSRRPGGYVRVESASEEFVEFVDRVGADRVFSEPIGYLERVSEDRVPDVRFF